MPSIRRNGGCNEDRERILYLDSSKGLTITAYAERAVPIKVVGQPQQISPGIRLQPNLVWRSKTASNGHYDPTLVWEPQGLIAPRRKRDGTRRSPLQKGRCSAYAACTFLRSSR